LADTISNNAGGTPSELEMEEWVLRMNEEEIKQRSKDSKENDLWYTNHKNN
jgi:hypothetical protein